MINRTKTIANRPHYGTTLCLGWYDMILSFFAKFTGYYYDPCVIKTESDFLFWIKWLNCRSPKLTYCGILPPILTLCERDQILIRYLSSPPLTSIQCEEALLIPSMNNTLETKDKIRGCFCVFHSFIHLLLVNYYLTNNSLMAWYGFLVYIYWRQECPAQMLKVEAK